MMECKSLNNGFEYIEIINESASAKIALQGGHIYHYARSGERAILWLSEESDFEHGKAIRGGVPLCWPWFGMNSSDSTLPQHGFARTSLFSFESAEELDSKHTEIKLKLTQTKESLKLWPYHFELIVEFIIGETLEIKLSTTNLDQKPFEITQALHSYFKVLHIDDVKIGGLEDKPYFDALTSEQCRQEGVITFDQEVDRVYQEVNSEIVLEDTQRQIKINNSNSHSVVVWNPWIEKTKRMSAMNDDAYETMVCIESANAREDARVIKKGDTHTLSAIIA